MPTLTSRTFRLPARSHIPTFNRSARAVDEHPFKHVIRELEVSGKKYKYFSLPQLKDKRYVCVGSRPLRVVCSLQGAHPAKKGWGGG